MREAVFIAIILLRSFHTIAQVNYTEAASRFQQYYNHNQPDSLFNLFTPKMKAALPLDKIKEMMSQLHNQAGELKSLKPIAEEATYVSYKADFTNIVFQLNLALNSNNLLQGFGIIPYQDKSMVRDTDNVVVSGIHGTLTMPAGNKKVPVVLLIAGSGPTDRNGNSLLGVSSNCYKLLANALSAAGIACLRYDKRGVGASAAALRSEAETRFEDMISDATELIKMLKTDSRFSRIFIAGHSEGSLIGMIAAERSDVAGFISIAGAGECVGIVVEKQLRAQSPGMAKTAAVLLDSLKNKLFVKNTGNILPELFRPSMQPYLISWLQYDPQVEIKKLKMPVLIIQGNTDLQVSMQDATLLKQAKPDARLLEIDKMNHVLKEAPADSTANFATYKIPSLPLKKEFITAVTDFVAQ